MSLDDTAQSVWEIKRQPVALLAAVKAGGLLVAELPSEQQAPFIALFDALLAWWPKRDPEAKLIDENQLRPCLELAETTKSAKMKQAVEAAHICMAALLKVAPRSQFFGGFSEWDEKSFQTLLRSAAKVGKLPVAQLEARLKLLREHEAEKWPQLVERAGRMSWVRGEPWAKLDKRVRALAAFADLGALSSWTEVSGRPALRLVLDGSARVAMLTADEVSALRRIIPSIPEPLVSPPAS